MPRNIIYSTLDVTPYSNWHRNCHDGIAMTDIDKISICPGCAKPLFIADTIYNNNQGFAGKSSFLQTPYKTIALELNIPYFEIFYSVDESTKERKITKFYVKRIYPYSKGITQLAPDDWLKFLEYKVLQHCPDCNNKDYLLRKVKSNKSNNTFLRQENYVKLLSE